VTEHELLAEVTGLCEDLGLWWHHEPDSRRSPAGWVDLVILGRGHVIFAELKNFSRGRSPRQVEIGYRLMNAGLRYVIWRPQHLASGEIRRELEAIA